MIWDRGNTHKGHATRRVHADYPRLTSHWLPRYAPKLNPVEHIWNHLTYDAGTNYLPARSTITPDASFARLAETRSGNGRSSGRPDAASIA